MSIVHGSMGIMYFCHIFTPAEDDKGLLDTPTAKLLSPRSTPRSRRSRRCSTPSRSPTERLSRVQVPQTPRSTSWSSGTRGAVHLRRPPMRPVAATGSSLPRCHRRNCHGARRESEHSYLRGELQRLLRRLCRAHLPTRPGYRDVVDMGVAVCVSRAKLVIHNK